MVNRYPDISFNGNNFDVYEDANDHGGIGGEYTCQKSVRSDR